MIRGWPLAAPLLLVMLVVIPLLALLAQAPLLDPGAIVNDVYLRRVVLFTLGQAGLSTLLSVGLALPVARALARQQRFLGRGVLLALFGLPVVMPSIVAVFGIVAVYGQSGWLNQGLAAVGLPTGAFLYGLGGIVLAHAFFNVPLSVRLLLPLWGTIPGEHWRIARQLGLNSAAVWRWLEWPLLRQALPGVVGLVFMLCFTSFAVVLTLGGGPAATTLEVAIYQALRFDYDIGRAVLLAAVQLLLCGLLVAVIQGWSRSLAVTATPGRLEQRPDGQHWRERCLDGLGITLVTLTVLAPVAAVVLAGLRGPWIAVLSDPALWASTARSLLVALASGGLTLLLGAALALAAREYRLRRQRPRWAAIVELLASLVLVVPPLVLGSGYFVLLMGVADIFAWGLVLVVLVNALMGLPYVFRLLGPGLDQVAAEQDRLCASLALSGWQRLRWVEWPLLRRRVGMALALTTALATGDLGVIALFGIPETTTLPLRLYQQLGSYRMAEAAVTALLLLILCLGLFVVLERGVGGGSGTNKPPLPITGMRASTRN